MTVPPTDRRPRRSIPFGALFAAVIAVQVLIIGTFVALGLDTPA